MSDKPYLKFMCNYVRAELEKEREQKRKGQSIERGREGETRNGGESDRERVVW
jgi:hypothetical protein